MNSIGKECDELKKVYEDCFNSWFSEKFLRGNKQDPCADLFLKYQACVKKAMKEQKIGECINGWSSSNNLKISQMFGKWKKIFLSQKGNQTPDSILRSDVKTTAINMIDL